jgi:predicted nuclease with TOPRIM domain
MADIERCSGCYEDPADGHIFDCPTRIRDLEAEVERLHKELVHREREFADVCAHEDELEAEVERLRERIARKNDALARIRNSYPCRAPYLAGVVSLAEDGLDA